MKLLIYIISIVTMTNFLVAEKPEPLKDFRFNFPKYEIDETDGKTDLIYVLDDSQPIINFRLMIFGGNSVESKPSQSEFTASMLTKGTKSYEANQIASTLDGLGAKLNISSNDDFISINFSVLKKHLAKALPILKEIINEPTFDSDELKKLKIQAKAVLASEKANPSSLASKLSKKVVYGKSHEYSGFPNEEDIENIEIEDLEAFHKKFFHQGNMSLAIYGDFNDDISNQIIDLISELPSDKNSIPKILVSSRKPYPNGVYFIERPGSVQSSIRLVYPGLAYSDDNFEKLSFISNIIGAGFTGRLFRTLREEYSYTYTPFAYSSNNKYLNMLIAGADVNKEVTDSAITVTLEQISDLVNNEVSKDELNSIKKYKKGNFQMSFEKSSFIASLLQNGLFKGVKPNFIENYVERLENFRSMDLKLIAQNHLQSDQAYIIVVGPSEVKSELEQFGKVYEYNTDIEPATNYLKVDLSAKGLIKKYVEAIGGADNIEDIETITTTGKAVTTMNGRSVPSDYLDVKRKGKFYQSIGMAGAKQEKWFDGKKQFVGAAGLKNEIPITKETLLEAHPFGVSQLLELDFECKVLGSKNGIIFLESKSNTGPSTIYKFDENTFLLIGSVASQETPAGIMEIDNSYSEYKTFDKVKLPTKVSTKSQFYSMEMTLEYEIDEVPSGVKFQPEE